MVINMIYKIPYGKTYMAAELDNNRVAACLESKKHEAGPDSEADIVNKALNSPINSPSLSDLCKSKENILIITSDHTRPMPSKITLPALLAEIRKGNPGARIKILIATGFHRATTVEEMKDRFGEEIVLKEELIVHDCRDESNMSYKGRLPSGCSLYVNALVDWADLVVAEGFIEPHFMAGFSGGRKSILPGICSYKTIMANHSSRLVADMKSRAGNLDGNIMHADMADAAKKTGLTFILNVALDEEKKIIAAFAGDPENAHNTGCSFVKEHTSVRQTIGDIVITSNGGYPLDQNLYQLVKCMASAKYCVREGGVIIAVGSCIDGHGGEGFYSFFKESDNAEQIIEKIMKTNMEDTLADQWEAQILAQIQKHCGRVLVVSRDVDPGLIKDMYMEPYSAIEEAVKAADDFLGYEGSIVVIPNGAGISVSVD